MKLSEELYDLSYDYVFSDRRTFIDLAEKAEALEQQVNDLMKYIVKYSNTKKEVALLHKKIASINEQTQDLIHSEAEAIKMINRMKCCSNCKYQETDGSKTPCVICDRAYPLEGNNDKWEMQQ